MRAKLLPGSLLSSLILLIFLNGCGSTPKNTTQPVQPEVEKAPEVPLTINPQDYIRRAEQRYAQNGNVQQRNQLLVKAVSAYHNEQQCQQAVKIGQLILPELNSAEQQANLQLVLIDCALRTVESNPQAQKGLVEQLQSQFTRLPTSFKHSKAAQGLLARINVQQQQWLDAASALLASETETGEHSATIWRWVNMLSDEQLKRAITSHSQLLPWLDLALISRTQIDTTTQFANTITGWQSSYPLHPLASQLPPEIKAATELQPITATNIAVLLPLSGKLNKQGLAIKQGILAAYFDQQTHQTTDAPAIRLHFFDSNVINGTLPPLTSEHQRFQNPMSLTNTENAAQAPSSIKYDMVIGPLRREKIAEVQQSLNPDTSWLALNQSTPSNSNPNHFTFALSPEDEAKQMAEHLFAKKHQKPIVIAANKGTAKRMAKAFSARWQQLTGNLPELSMYQNSKQMRDRVARMLAVKQSEERILQIKYMSKLELHDVPRNRQDIDAAVLFASPSEAGLLNPIIEASISPFSQNKIAVFASSRSYRQRLDSNNKRDLRAITFTEMPWLLPHSASVGLSNQTHQLWPNQAEGLQRLFALGYDAYHLIPHLRHLRLIQGSSINGLTGQIRINKQGNIQRKLATAIVDRQGIKALEQD